MQNPIPKRIGFFVVKKFTFRKKNKNGLITQLVECCIEDAVVKVRLLLNPPRQGINLAQLKTK
jgi:hypothetical protein